MKRDTWETDVLPFLDDAWPGSSYFGVQAQEVYWRRLNPYPGPAVALAVSHLVEDVEITRRPSIAVTLEAVQRAMLELRWRLPAPGEFRCAQCDTPDPAVYLEDLGDGTEYARGRCGNCGREIEVLVGEVEEEGPRERTCSSPVACAGVLVLESLAPRRWVCTVCGRDYLTVRSVRTQTAQEPPDGRGSAWWFAWVSQTLLPVVTATAWDHGVEFALDGWEPRDPGAILEPHEGPQAFGAHARVPAAVASVIAYGVEEGPDEVLRAVATGRPVADWIDLEARLREEFAGEEAAS